MANNCENYIIFRHPKGKAALEPFLTNGELDFGKIIPVPKNEVLSRAWCLRNWDTDRHVDLTNVESKDDRVSLYFVTAWSPPIAVMTRLSLILDTVLEATFLEPGVRYGERAFFTKGSYVIESNDFSEVAREVYGDEYFLETFGSDTPELDQDPRPDSDEQDDAFWDAVNRVIDDHLDEEALSPGSEANEKAATRTIH